MARKPKTERNEKLKKMYTDGATYRELAKTFNVSFQRVHQIITGYTSPYKIRLDKLLKELSKERRQ